MQRNDWRTGGLENTGVKEGSLRGCERNDGKIRCEGVDKDAR